jgi:hypothetical protein
MPILFACSGCKNPISAPDGSEGQRGSCTACGKTIMVPADDRPLRLGISVDPDDLLDATPEPPKPTPAAKVSPAPVTAPIQRVRLIDVDIPFDRAVVILITWGFASVFASAIVLLTIGILPFILWAAHPK